MEIAVAALLVVDGPIRAKPVAGELLGYEFARQRDVLLKRQFGRKCYSDLAGELRVLALFEQLDAVPKRFRSRCRFNGMALQKLPRPWRRVCGNRQFRMQASALAGEVPDLACALVRHARRMPVGGRGHGALAVPPRDWRFHA